MDIRQLKQKLIAKSQRFGPALVVTIAAGGIGLYTYGQSGAATYVADIEAETGLVAGNAGAGDPSGASNDASIRFGITTTPTPPPPPPTCSLNATTANFASQVSAATAGQTICLATGNYGTFTGTNKAVTITRQAGATPVMNVEFNSGDSGFTIDGMSGMYGDMSGTARDITIRNSIFTQAIVMLGLSNANILLDNNVHNNIDISSTCSGWAGRILIGDSNNPAGVTVSNSMLSGGNTDGVRIDSPGVTVINNQFIDIKEKSDNDCAHTDSIQFYGGSGAIIRNNYFRGGSNGIVAFDRTSDNQITNNVCVSLARGACVTLYSDTDSVIEHNVAFGTMDVLEIDHKSGDPAGTGTVFRNNIGGLSIGNGSTVAINTKNLYSGASGTNINDTPVYAGGANPTTWAGFKLAANSPGKGAATDGLDIGIN